MRWYCLPFFQKLLITTCMIRYCTSCLCIYISPSTRTSLCQRIFKPHYRSCGFFRSQEWQKAVQLLVELEESLQSDVPLASSAWCFPEDQMWNSFQKVHHQHIVTIRAYSRGSTGCKYDLVELILGRFYSEELSTRINSALPKRASRCSAVVTLPMNELLCFFPNFHHIYGSLCLS